MVVEVGGVGYEVLLPPIVEQALGPLADGAPLDLKIAYVATRDQPTPVLYGFAHDEEKQFWLLLRSVAGIGPKVAARAMILPINRIAQAIQEQNTRLVDSLPGISPAGAEKIVATLRQKMATFAALEEVEPARVADSRDELEGLAVALLVVMGIKRPDAQRGVDQLLATREDITSIQDIVTEFLRAQRGRTQRPG